MSICLIKHHAMEMHGGNAGTNPHIAQHVVQETRASIL
jgi:hypothetical protein